MLLIGRFGSKAASDESYNTACAVGKVIEGIGDNGYGRSYDTCAEFDREQQYIAEHSADAAEGAVASAGNGAACVIGVFDKASDKQICKRNIHRDHLTPLYDAE
jgi:hypothetical protein